MMNPIMQMLNKGTSNNRLNDVMQVMNILKSGNPEAIFNQMMNSNPQFKSFIEQNKGKTPEQIAQDYNVDISPIKSFLYK